MRGLWVAAALAALTAATPAAAADVATLGCVKDEMPAQVRTEIVAVVRGLADGGAPKFSQALRDDLAVAGAACAARHGWSDVARQAAQGQAMASASLDVAWEIATKRGVRLDIFTAGLRALTDDQRFHFLQSEPAAIDALMAQLTKRGMTNLSTNRGQYIVVHLLAILTFNEEGQRAIFAAT
jgi:hypothetical protein